MDSKIENSITHLALTNSEAVVLLEWLTRFNSQEAKNVFDDPAEERVLFDLESILEKVVQETLSEDYQLLLARARKEVNK